MSSAAIRLPAPRTTGRTSLEEVLLKRRSIRDYRNEPITLAEISQLLWAAQGTTHREGLRAAPSAGALYPLELYVVIGNAQDLAPGIYKYSTGQHALSQVVSGDQRSALAAAALEQPQVTQGAISLVFSAVYERTMKKYRERAVRYVHMEAGHAAQNVYLQATALNLGTVVLGAFEDARVKRVVNMPADEQPLYIMPIGRIR